MLKRLRSLRDFLAGALVVIALSSAVTAQEQNARSAPMPMPADRATESYQIYSSLMPLGETAGRNWPHERWLVADATVTVVPDGESCKLDPTTLDKNSVEARTSMNPHLAVHPPENRRNDFNEILRDFDRHCHDRITLDPSGWSLPVPVVLLSSEEEAKYKAMRFTGEPVDEKYKGAPGVYAFSMVYFNENHTVALVYATHNCGSLCGEGSGSLLLLKAANGSDSGGRRGRGFPDLNCTRTKNKSDC